MKRLLAVSLLLTVGLAAKSPFAGTWEANINDLPGIQLNLRNAPGDKVEGDIMFFFQRQGDDGKWRVEGEPARGPILDPRVDGRFLSFEVRHHKQHGGTEYGPNVKYRTELTGENELTFVSVNGKSDGPQIKLRRRKP